MRKDKNGCTEIDYVTTSERLIMTWIETVLHTCTNIYIANIHVIIYTCAQKCLHSHINIWVQVLIISDRVLNNVFHKLNYFFHYKEIL
jgi:hypothetical protein